MNSTTETISPLRQRLLDDMRMRKLSPKTQSGYPADSSPIRTALITTGRACNVSGRLVA